jgi:primosomal protein N' (replication factor Y)
MPMPAERAYSYALPEGVEAGPGQIVQVPLGPRLVAGVVWDGEADKVNPDKLREITQVFDCPPLNEPMRRFIDWVSAYTLSPPGLVARMALQGACRLRSRAADRCAQADGCAAGTDDGGARAGARAGGRRAGLDQERAGACGRRDAERHRRALRARGVRAGETAAAAGGARSRSGLRAGGAGGRSAEAADALSATVAKSGFGVTLLDGVTGSGKTEVYFEAIAEAVRAGRQVLILLPEIALTAQFLDRFHERFGARPAEWHSELAPRMREKVWRQVTEGRVSVVAGARSALFLPFADLGLIIVDEEHDPAYKQEDRVFYNARDMAVVRARLGGFRSCWRLQHRRSKAGSTPQQGRYSHLKLPGRYADAGLPDLARRSAGATRRRGAGSCRRCC